MYVRTYLATKYKNLNDLTRAKTNILNESE